MSFLKNMFGTSEGNQYVSKVGWIQLTDLDQLDEIISESKDKLVIVFKHSTRCGVSRMVLKQFEKEFDLQEKTTSYFLDLLEYRNVSNEITSRFKVVHESPQLLLIRDGKTIYHASHSNINAEDLKIYI